MKIGLLSDTHSFLDEAIFRYFDPCDEVWHAGDFGNWEVAEQLQAFRPLRGVYGNIDGTQLRQVFPENLRFEVAGLDVFMTHIGGYPGRYTKRVREIIAADPPQLYICGHSHILKIMPDKKYDLLHMNPGACGHHGFHKVRTVVRFAVEEGSVRDVEVVELGIR